jgi:hypothetical protein
MIGKALQQYETKTMGGYFVFLSGNFENHSSNKN